MVIDQSGKSELSANIRHSSSFTDQWPYWPPVTRRNVDR